MTKRRMDRLMRRACALILAGIVALGVVLGLVGCPGASVKLGCKYDAQTKVWDCGVEAHRHAEQP